VQKAIVAQSGSKILQALSPLNALVVQLPAGQEDAALSFLSRDPAVENIEEDAVLSVPALSPEGGAQGFITPAEPGSNGYGWNLLQIKYDLVSSFMRNKGVNVAILDTGIDPNHPALSSSIAGGYNARAGENPNDWIDRNGHGTHVAGIIAAKLQGQGVSGVTPKSSLYAVKVLDNTGGGYLSDLINGLLWINQHQNLKIQVVNMSLGFYQGSDLLHQVIQKLYARGIVLVASVGNDDCTTTAASEGGDSEGGDSEGGDSEGGDSGTGCTREVKYPAKYPEVIGVGATDIYGKITYYSVQGLEVDVVAPGGTRAQPVLSTNIGGGYGFGSGTSQAAAHVSGVAALLEGINSALSPDLIRAILQTTAQDLGVDEVMQGAGLIDAFLATQ
jgi:subtilisin family serine protease